MIIRDIFQLDDTIWQPIGKWLKFLHITQAVRFEGPVADFLTYNAADWTITKVELGYGSAVIALQNVVGGVLKITNDDADNDSVQFQLKGEPFKLASNKPLKFEVKFKCDEATQVDLLFGICITDTTLIAGFSDGVIWKKDDGDTNLDFQSVKANTPTNQAAIGTLVANTWTRLGFRFDGHKTLMPYINGTEYASKKIQTNIPTEELTISFAIMNGEAAAKSLELDYIFCAQQR